MPAAEVAPDGAPAVSRTSSKLGQLLRKRLRLLARATLVLAVGLAVAATGLAIWWLTSLNGLPDIGDPFDVAAFRAFRIPDEQNAFVFFRRANEKLSPLPALPGRAKSGRDGRLVQGRSEGPRLGRGESPGARALPAGCRTLRRDLPTGPESPRPLFRGSGPALPDVLALLEGGRREEGGDMAGAWDCYRAVLRSTVLGAQARGDRRALPCHRSPRLVAEPARDLGGRSQDDDPAASTRLGGGGRDPSRGPSGMPFRSRWNTSTGCVSSRR